MSTSSTVGLGHCWRRAPVGLAGLIVLGATSAAIAGEQPRCAFAWMPMDTPALSEVSEFLVFNDRLLAGGAFWQPGSSDTYPLSEWDGRAWRQFGADSGHPLLGIAGALVIDDTDGSLYVGGALYRPGDPTKYGIARWNGSDWETIGGGFTAQPGGGLPRVSSLRFFEAGRGRVLLVGGYFNSVGGVPAKALAAWDGAAWSAIGEFDVQSDVFVDPIVADITVANLGFGDAVVVGGTFDEIDGAPMSHVAAWDGQNWSAVGAEIQARGQHPVVQGLPVVNGQLWAVGSMRVPGAGVCAWNGASWVARDAGLDFRIMPGFILARGVTTFDDGRGPAFYLGGSFAGDANVPRHVARWNETLGSWASVGDGIDDLSRGTYVLALIPHDDGTTVGGALYAGGNFVNAAGQWVPGVARWGCLRGDVNCDARVDFFDVDPFLVALFAPGDHPTLYPDCAVIHADANGDGAVDLFDVDPFIERILDRL